MDMSRRSGKRSARALGAAAFLLAPLSLGLTGCAQEEYPLSLWMEQHPDSGAQQAADGSASPDGTVTSLGTCHRALAQALPQRLATMSASVSTGNDLVYVQTLFDR